MFDPFANKLSFQSFTVDCPPCPKCSCDKALISPTTNTHAASARCAGCNKFYRWLGKKELQSYAYRPVTPQGGPQQEPVSVSSSSSDKA